MTYNEKSLKIIKSQNEIDVEKYKSIIKAGNITIYNPDKFNKLQKWLWKKLLNIEIEDVEVEQ